MKNDIPEMVDVAFDLKAGPLPNGYAFALWDEVVRILPWFEDEKAAGIIPLRGAEDANGILLAKRSRLVLRLPAARAAQAAALSGQVLEVGSGRLEVGAATRRSLQPFATLHSHLVEGAGEEESFLAEMAEQLEKMEVACERICGRHGSLSSGARSVSGYSLVLHDLKPEGSLRVQRAGLGGNRRFGCGIFVPYKTISGLA